MICPHCDEPFEAGEYSVEINVNDVRREFHRECAIRMVSGSVAHLEKRCGCYVPGSTESDDPAISKRVAARRAAAILDQQVVDFRQRNFPEPTC